MNSKLILKRNLYKGGEAKEFAESVELIKRRQVDPDTGGFPAD